MMGDVTPFAGLILLATFVVSVAGFMRDKFREDYLFDPERILAHREYYRILTSGFLHADWFHFLMNMVSFHAFGSIIELIYGAKALAIIYFAAIIGGSLISLCLHRNHPYRALGASGGVCGVIFASIFLVGGGVVMWPIPIPVPGWLYAIFFLVVSYIRMRGGKDNIGHDAHIGGALVGLLVATVMFPQIVTEHPRLYFAVLLITGALFWHLWRYPMFISSGWPFDSALNDENHPRYSTAHLREPREVDRILEKISAQGMASLTQEEREVLNRRAEKLRRREE